MHLPPIQGTMPQRKKRNRCIGDTPTCFVLLGLLCVASLCMVALTSADFDNLSENAYRSIPDAVRALMGSLTSSSSRQLSGNGFLSDGDSFVVPGQALGVPKVQPKVLRETHQKPLETSPMDASATTPRPVERMDPVGGETEEESAARCKKMCKAQGYCCNDFKVGSNQLLSCAQACMVRARGSSKPECLEQCGNLNCFPKLNGYTYETCSSCTDIDEETCPVGVQSPDECEDGCAMSLREESGGIKFKVTTSAPEATSHLLSESASPTLQRMRWWFKRAPLPLPIERSYLLHNGDAGGPNNIRIGWEVCGIVARYTGRIFVLPPAERMYLLDFGPMNEKRRKGIRHNTKTKIEDLIDLGQLKTQVPTMTWAEFQEETGLTWKEAIGKAAKVPNPSSCRLSPYRTITEKFLYMNGDQRREGFSCGEWWARGAPKDTMQRQMSQADWAVLTHGFVWHDDIFRLAAQRVEHLGIFNYIAVHARYNDFQFKEARKSQEAIFEELKPLLKLTQTLYVASDESDRFKNAGSKYGVRVITYDDMFKDSEAQLKSLEGFRATLGAERFFKLVGPTEELVCTYALVFVGTDKSSFTGHIHRMRVHAGAPEARKLTHTGRIDAKLIAGDIDAWKAKNLATKFKPRSPFTGDSF